MSVGRKVSLNAHSLMNTMSTSVSFIALLFEEGSMTSLSITVRITGIARLNMASKKLMKTEKKIEKKLERLAIRRYEKSYPGEMVHADTKLLPRLKHETKGTHRERLYVAIDDFSRCLVADILPDKSQESSAVFGEVVLDRLPFDIKDWYTDRGTEWKGTSDHIFVAFCREQNISQHFTKPRTPQTNGKAERVIRTLMEEWHRKQTFTSKEDRRRKLYEYVEFFNHERVHGTLGITPIQKLTEYSQALPSGDNA